YIEDLIQHRARVLHVAFVRSPFPSARIHNINTALARQAEGVVAVVTGEDIAQHVGSLPRPGAPFLPGFPEAPEHPILAHEFVRLVGEPVAAVVAESVAQAYDARDLVEVDYEPEPAVADLEQALAPKAPLVHVGFSGNVLSRRQHVSGDPDKAFAM